MNKYKIRYNKDTGLYTLLDHLGASVSTFNRCSISSDITHINHRYMKIVRLEHGFFSYTDIYCSKVLKNKDGSIDIIGEIKEKKKLGVYKFK